FPYLIFRQSLDLYPIAAAISVAAALAGSARALWSVIALPPAVAMQPPAPARYRTLFGGGIPWLRTFSRLTLMSFRPLARSPVRTLLTALGTSFAVALLVTSMFSSDSTSYMVDTVFFRSERQDATLSFSSERSPRALQAVAALPGVMRAEGFRAASVILHFG